MVEAPPDIEKYYRCFEAYVKKLPRYNHRISISVQRLSKLSLNHLQELSNDIFDEISRRNTSTGPGHLSPRPDIHKKRNNARYQFGDLTAERIGDMCRDLVAELDRRFPTLRQDVPVPEIPPLHRTRTVKSAGTGAGAGAGSSAASTPIIGTPLINNELKPDTSADIDSSVGMKNLKQTQVVPTKSKMAMDSDESDSPSEYEYYNPDTSGESKKEAGVPALPTSPPIGHPEPGLDATPPASQPFSGSRRTPFEQRLAAATNNTHDNLGFGTDFNFEDQLPQHSLSDELTFDEEEHTQDEPDIRSLSGSDIHSLDEFGSPNPDIEPEMELHAESPLVDDPLVAEPDIMAYVNKLEDQVKELQLINSQTIEENQQLHDMLADTETERKQIANEVKVLRDRSSTDTTGSMGDRDVIGTERKPELQKKLDAAEAKAARLEVQLNELTKEHQKLEDAHTKLETEHNSSRNTHQELSDKHQDLEQQLSELVESHSLLQEAHNNLRVVHDQHKADYAALQESQDTTLSRQVDAQLDSGLDVDTLAKQHQNLLNRHNDLDMKHSALESSHRTIKNEYTALQEAFSDLQNRYASAQNQGVIQGSHIPNGLNIRNLDTSDEYTRLLAQHNTLLGDLERQREVTEQVRKEAQRFLREMREMTESRSGQTYVNFQKELANAEQQTNYWKAKYQKTVEEMQSSRTRSRESMLSQPSVMSDKFYDSNGLVAIEHVDKYQHAVTELLQATQRAPESILDYLHTAILSVEDILGEVAADDTRFAKEIRLVSNTAHQLISSTRNFAEASPVFPVGVITAACSDVSYAISEFLRHTKVRHEEFVKYRPRSRTEASPKQADVPRLPYSPTRGDNDRLKRYSGQGELNGYSPNRRRSSGAASRMIAQKSVASILPGMQATSPVSKRSSVSRNGSAQSPAKILEHGANDTRNSQTTPPPGDRRDSNSRGLQSPARMEGYRNTDLKRSPRVRGDSNRSPGRSADFGKTGSNQASLSPTRSPNGASLQSPVKIVEFASNRDQKPHTGEYTSTHTSPRSKRSSGVSRSHNHTVDQMPESKGDSHKESQRDTNHTRAASIDYSKDFMSPGSMGSARLDDVNQVTFGTARAVDTTSPQDQVRVGSPTPSGGLNRPAAAPLRIDTTATTLNTDPTSPYTSDPSMEPMEPAEKESLRVGSPTTPGGILSPEIVFKEDSTVAELQAYLEEQTSETVDSIRELLTGIKADSVVNELKPLVGSIVYYVSLMVKTTGVCMKRTENWMLKDKGSFILQNLDDCCRRMASLRENLDHFEGGEVAPRPLKQRLAAVSFDIAKCTKELVKTVEDVSLKSELEHINARLQNATI